MSKPCFLSEQVCCHQRKGTHFTESSSQAMPACGEGRKTQKQQKERGLFSSSKHHTKARSCFQQFCWHWVTSSLDSGTQGLPDIRTIPHLILRDRKGKPQKAGARQRRSFLAVIWFTNSKLFSPVIVSLIRHILAPKATLAL